MSQEKDTPKGTRRTTPTSKSLNVLTAGERAAMKELVQARKAEARGQDGEDAAVSLGADDATKPAPSTEIRAIGAGIGRLRDACPAAKARPS